MKTPATFTKSGTKATVTAKLDKAVFDVMPTNHELLKSAYVAYLANGRLSLAKTKTRGLVRGGGKKPWKQKGTGRARFGSSRVPIWRGGGITFGPTGNENHSHKLHVNAKRQAIRQALSLAVEGGKLVVLEDFVVKGKTADAANLLKKVGVEGNTLLVTHDKTADLVRATSNLNGVTLVHARYLNVYDLLNADHIVITSSALAAVHEWLSSSPKASKNKQQETKDE